MCVWHSLFYLFNFILQTEYENEIQRLTNEFQQLKTDEIEAVHAGIELEIEASKQQLEVAHQEVRHYSKSSIMLRIVESVFIIC